MVARGEVRRREGEREGGKVSGLGLYFLVPRLISWKVGKREGGREGGRERRREGAATRARA